MDDRVYLGVMVLVASVLLPACRPAARLVTAAAERVGCSDPDVAFSDVETKGTRREWAMECGGEAWRCGGTTEADASCVRDPVPRMGVVAGATGSASWKAYESACGVSVDFPGTPVRSTTEVRVQGETSAIETETFEAEGTNAMMAATCTTIGPAHEGVVALLDLTRNSVLAGAGARLLEEQPSIGGRELLFSVHDREALARFVIVGDRLLSLVVAPVDAFPEEGARRFLDSPRRLLSVEARVAASAQGNKGP